MLEEESEETYRKCYQEVRRMKVGLVGEKLGHSFSKPIHERLTDYTYDLIPLSKEEFHRFFEEKSFDAVNVTIPYKQAVMEYCDEIDGIASSIGAVNAVVNRDGKLYATNTDFEGLRQMIVHRGIEIGGKVCCILGTGGTSRTARAVLAHMGAKEIYTAGRGKEAPVIAYEQLSDYKDIQVIVNATSVGMYPDNDHTLIDCRDFPKLEAVVDVIYNPLRTKLCQQAAELGLKEVNGLEMLVAQAKAAAEFFLGAEILDGKVQEITNEMRREMSNIVLIGMPGCGKSTIGECLAKLTGRTLVDLDKEIERAAGMEIREIFAREGEEGFRKREHDICRIFAREHGQILSCGGGIVKNEKNMRLLAQNGRIFHIRRNVDVLSLDESRPLSTSRERLVEMERERMPLYEKYSDVTVENHTSVLEAAQRVKEEFDENFSD